MANKKFTITGKVSGRDKQALPNLRIEVWDKDLLVDDFLGEDRTDESGAFAISFTQEYFKELFLDREPDLYFKIYDNDVLIRSTENTVLWNVRDNQENLHIILDYKKHAAPEEPEAEMVDGNNSIQITGQVLSTRGIPLSGYSVEAFVKTIDKEFSVAKTATNSKGLYTLNFVPSSPLVDVQIKTYPADDKNNLVASKVNYNVKESVTIDVIIPLEQVHSAPEFETVGKKIQAHLGQLQLEDLKESEGAGHITFLSNKTGLDLRIVAMYVAANQIASKLGIVPEHAYAMFRSGVPGNAAAIQSMSADAILEALEKAKDKNIISNDKNANQTLEVLSSKTTDFVLNSKPSSSVSSMNEMLDLRLNGEQKQLFAQVFAQSGSDPSKLWTDLAENGFSQDTVQKLQLDGKLGFLTGQNAALIKKIYQVYPMNSEADLAGHQLYKADAWKEVIKDAVPSELTEDVYAKHLANQVKLNYPNEVAASRIQNEEINLGDNAPLSELAQFLTSNSSTNTIGALPVKLWEGYAKLSTQGKAAAKSFERLYQLSPSDESMIAMSQNGIHSAYQIARYTESEFMARYGKSFPNSVEAKKVFAKGNEVYSAALNIATGYITQRASPNVFAITGNLNNSENATIAYPTLEELFGNMDYCACDHCKSVLSPAAYLVELLQFIDLADIPHDGMNPINALTDRRPDIENIQLSCENTNMALPYIDLVNEILEYYILHDNLENLEGHDVTEGNTQAELLAEPQFVEQSVYETELKEEVFPYNLPFHQPLETLRRIFNLWGVSFESCLRIFSTPLAARKEALSISEEEYETLTNLEYKNLPLYFGEPEDNTIAQLNAAIANGKEFSRRVGITNEQLVQLLKTNFINPGYVLTAQLQKLAVPLADLQEFYDGTISGTQLDALIPDTIDAADYDGDVKEWLNSNQAAIMGLITLTDVGSPESACNFAEVELRYALPDNTQNSLTAVAYHKFHRFLRLMTKTGWSIETLDEVMKPLMPRDPLLITEENIDETFVTLLDRIANFLCLADLLSYSQKKYPNLLLLLDTTQTLELRQQQLASVLKINLAEVLDLALLIGVDPLANDLENDEPSLIKFVRTIKRLKANGLKTNDLSYLLRHQDTTGKLIPNQETLLTHINLIKDAINKVETENSIASDNADFELAKSKMLLVYDAVTTDTFFGLLLGTTTYKTSFVTTEEDLPEPLLSVDAKLSFDAFKKELTYTGVLSSGAKTALENATAALLLADLNPSANAADLTTFKTDFNAALSALDTSSNTDLNNFSTNFPELKVIYDIVTAESDPAVRAQQIVTLILPDLKYTLKANAIQQVLISILKAEAELVQMLSSETEALHAEADTTKNLRYDFEQLEQIPIFDQNQSYTFYVDVPSTDDYVFYLSAPENSRVSLSVNGDTIINNEVIGTNNEVSNAIPLALKAGTLHTLILDLASLPASEALSLFWRTKGMAKTPIPDAALYAKEQVDFATISLIRLEKAIQISQIFKINALELEYFATLNSETRNFLNELPVTSGIDTSDLEELWTKIDRLVYFQGIKKLNEPEENTWLSVLLNPDLENSPGNFLLESFNAWQEADLSEVLDTFGFVRADLSNLTKLQKVMEAMTLVNKIGFPAVQSLTWMTNDPSYDLVRGIKEAIKDQLTESVWLESMQSVNDVVRNKLRDALVSYILQYKRPSAEIDNPDKLYEYFLIDVEMDACMKTSRIRQALSTVQLFIQRCLMNLEPTVAASSIRAEQWAWMKRYRVWEANRKVFLYPENWLEPELRDNKSTFFKELEGEMMQQEITDESAELAFLNYLKKLDDIAKLEMVGMYLEENEQGNQDDDILHVIGRTNGNTRQYYYRRYEYGYWTPWEKISLNMEGDHIFPIVWKKRLFIFWLNIVEKPAPVSSSLTPTQLSTRAISSSTRKNIEINMCWGEYYKGKWTSPKSTELNKPLIISNLDSFDKKQLLMHGRTDRVEKPAGKFRERLIFDLQYLDPIPFLYGSYYTIGGKFTFTSKNAPPLVESYIHDDELQTKVVKPNKKLFIESQGQASLYYNQVDNGSRIFSINVEQPSNALQPEVKETIFTKTNELTNGFSILPLRHPIENQFESPLSYADERSTLFAQLEETVTYFRDIDIYYPVFDVPITIVEPPIIIEEPIPNWPPMDPYGPDFGGVVINPWEGGNPWEGENPVMNPNINTIIPTDLSFQYGDTVFDNQGMITEQQRQF